MGRPSLPSAPSALAVLRLLALLVLLTLGGAAWPAGTGQPAPLRFNKLSALGFDNPSTLSLLQDRQGFVWIGTNSGGLYRYDGYQAVRYANQPDNPRSLPHDRVSAVFEDRDGRIWAGTQNGLARFEPESNDFTLFLPLDGPRNRRIVKTILDDGKGGMWLGTWGGVQHFDPRSGAFAQYFHDPADPASLATNDVNALALDADGGLWATTWPGGIDYLAPGARRFRHYRLDGADAGVANPHHNVATALHLDRQRRLWIGTHAGLLRWDTRRPWRERRVLPSPGGRVTRFFADRHQTLWVATLAAGLLRWDAGGERFERFVHDGNDPFSLQSDHVETLLHDRSGMLWVGSYTDGVSLVNLNSAGFTRHLPHDVGQNDADPAAPALRSNALRSMANAAGGRLWLGTDNGFSLFDPARGAVLRSFHAGRDGNNRIYSLYQGAGGPLWIGSSAGLLRLDRPGAAPRAIHFGNAASDHINTIQPGRGGVLWIGTGNSLVRYEPATDARRVFSNDPADPHSRSVNGSSSVLEDRRGRLWAGSEWNGGGLDMLAPGGRRFRHFRHDPANPASLAADDVSALFEDRDGDIWVGTAKGLHRLSTDAAGAITLRSYAALPGIANTKILAIQADAAGALWLSTAAGLARLDRSSGALSRFTPADGLSEVFLPGASAAGPDGVLYFGGVRGMTAVDPARVRSVTLPPQVAITDITVFNRSLGDGRPVDGVTLAGPVTAPTALTLAARASVFSIEFAALHFTEPNANRYAYRLEGFDESWIETGAAHRSATYTRLAPGRYLFRVRAANHRGVWSEQEATLPITVTPPLWGTWWFRAGAALLALGALAAAYRWRVARLTRHQATLEALVAARTRELEESNRKLAALSTSDALTGAANRRGFDLALEAEWRRAMRTGQPLALAMVDVDHFKQYNDHYGHPEGDRCLRAVAGLIARHGRRTTDLVARYGGEEFALLAAASNADDAFGTARALCAALQQLALPHAAAPLGIVTVSIGVASLTPAEGMAPERLVRLADQALYRAKQRGRNQAQLARPD